MKNKDKNVSFEIILFVPSVFFFFLKRMKTSIWSSFTVKVIKNWEVAWFYRDLLLWSQDISCILSKWYGEKIDLFREEMVLNPMNPSVSLKEWMAERNKCSKGN